MKNAARNWKTTIAGIFTLLMLAFNVYNNPAILKDPTGQAQVLAQAGVAVGLIVAKDGDQTGTAAQPKQ
ncbi:MAG: hypothetical protein ABSH05_07250 [Bryobacteraceae bacterium]|jgi:hypothetical protein